MDIIPGSKVDIVLDFDWLNEKIDVRRAVVYDLNDKRIVTSQTAPPAGSYNVGKKVKITYLLMGKDGWVRYGINGRLIRIVPDYRLSGSETAQAIEIIPEPGREFFNLRLFYRLQPPLDCGLALFLKKEKMNILNISLGGVKFTHSKDYPIVPKSRLNLTLQIDEQNYDIEAEAMRVSSVSGRMRRELEAVAVKFLNLDKKTQDLLSIKIKEVERKMLYKEAYAED